MMQTIELRPAEGGDDAKSFMHDLAATYVRYLEAKLWKHQITTSDSMVVITLPESIPGLINEAGGHRIQRVPLNEKRGRVHTSTVTVSVLSEQRRKTVFDQRAPEDFSYRWFSGTGKGGQRRNKVQTCLELTHIPTGMTQAAHGRSRQSNEFDAMQALCAKLDEARDGKGAQVQNDVRARQIGSGMRGDKRRTYRFQDDSVVDHQTGKKATCKRFMRGDIETLW